MYHNKGLNENLEEFVEGESKSFIHP